MKICVPAAAALHYQRPHRPRWGAERPLLQLRDAAHREPNNSFPLRKDLSGPASNLLVRWEIQVYRDGAERAAKAYEVKEVPSCAVSS